jgi:hypothetical protein
MDTTTTKGDTMEGDCHKRDVTAERLAERVAQLEAELETALRNLDAARAEIARLSATEASAAAAARQSTAGLR